MGSTFTFTIPFELFTTNANTETLTSPCLINDHVLDIVQEKRHPEYNSNLNLFNNKNNTILPNVLVVDGII